MKRVSTLSFLMVCMMALFSSCAKDNCEQTITNTEMHPVYMSYEEFRASVASESARPLENPGKIYLYNNHLFINERREGVHIIDMSDPTNPTNKGFIKILGNVDIAIRGDVLLADSFMDLVAIDISDIDNVKEVSRLEQVYQNDWNLGIMSNEQGVVVDWDAVETTETVDCNSSNAGGGRTIWLFDDLAFESADADLSSNNPQPVQGEGVAGSFARFTIVGQHLYTIDNSTLHTFSIDNPSQPVDLNTDTYVAWNIETIFPYGDHLFIGSQNGMIVMSVSDPIQPVWVSELQHFRGCDPVVVEDDYAYVTLRNGNPTCGGFENQLDVIDVSDVANPKLIKSYDMHNPHGLDVDDSTLFLCDGEDGLKVFDVTDKEDVTEMEHYKNIDTYDVIALGELLFMIGDDGFRLYDYSDLDDIHLVSSIPVNRQQ